LDWVWIKSHQQDHTDGGKDHVGVFPDIIILLLEVERHCKEEGSCDEIDEIDV